MSKSDTESKTCVPHPPPPSRRYFPASTLNGTVSAFTMCLTCVADLMEKHHRAPAVGFLLACFSIGILLGPGLGGTLPTLTAVNISVTSIAITWLYLVLFVPETAPGALARRAVKRNHLEAVTPVSGAGGGGVSKKDDMRVSLLEGTENSSGSSSSLASFGANRRGCSAAQVGLPVPESSQHEVLIPEDQVSSSAPVADPGGHKIPVAEAVAEALAAFKGPMGVAAVANSIHPAREFPASGSNASSLDALDAAAVASTHTPAAGDVVLHMHDNPTTSSSNNNLAHHTNPECMTQAFLPARGLSPFQSSSCASLTAQHGADSAMPDSNVKPHGSSDLEAPADPQHPPPNTAQSDSAAMPGKQRPGWRVLLADPWYRKIAFISVMQAIAFDGAQGMLIQYLQLVVGFNTQDQAKLFVVAAACGLFVKLAILPSLVKRVGEFNLLLIGLTAYVFQVGGQSEPGDTRASCCADSASGSQSFIINGFTRHGLQPFIWFLNL